MKKGLLGFIFLVLIFSTTACTSTINSNLSLSNNILFAINQNNKYGFIDYTGKEIVSPKFDAVAIGKDNDLYAVKLQGLWGYINSKGEMVIIPKYNDAKGFNNGLAYVTEDNYEGYINKKDQYVWKQLKQVKKVEKKVVTKKKVSAQKPTVKNDLADSILNEMGL